ncbi:MAG: GNAT family N-acetyltransferase [Sulfobacillus thermosulfidooxidans]|uniref:GNAT family N-acetyltransferase n=1 Tax=Sulfobacillus thermosulfidooxidans TaxID=28034 RepID=A0A2T2WK40_SULTH|nr:MAG: GNAT family N-acetyltransferase [Sulfobacillus thermosulfidooxidans]
MNALIRVEALASYHDRKHFHCPTGGLDDYLRQRATQDIKRRAAAVFVAVPSATPQRILGYYTLSSLSIKLADIPADYQRKLARYPDVGVTLLGRLAIDVSYRGQHLGEFLLVDALRRVIDTASTIATVALVVDTLEDSQTFYMRYGFTPLSNQRFWLPLDSARALMANYRPPIPTQEEHSP